MEPTGWNAGTPPATRDLCVIARADGRVEPEEMRVIRDIGAAIEVDPSLVHGVCSGLPEGD